jgi:hypothetical protein
MRKAEHTFPHPALAQFQEAFVGFKSLMMKWRLRPPFFYSMDSSQPEAGRGMKVRRRGHHRAPPRNPLFIQFVDAPE